MKRSPARWPRPHRRVTPTHYPFVRKGDPLHPLSRRTRLCLDRLESRETPSAGYLRIAEYNIAASTGSPATGLGTILKAIGDETVAGRSGQLDLLALQEVESQATTTQ